MDSHRQRQLNSGVVFRQTGAWCLALGLLGGSAEVHSAELVRFQIDLSRTNGIVRPLHGINKGPIAFGGLIDLTQPLAALHVPFIRLHDCQWPYPDVVDMHAIFRDPSADPAQPGNFDFALTDSYLKATMKTGARVVYRLGESIEHEAVKRYVHPPPDSERWADACLGIIRHYNQGWNNGFRYNIDYWEIWNEPENRPAMWSGSDEDYYRLYRTTARRIKHEFPSLKVGGPAVGYAGRWEKAAFVPSEFVANFLSMCRRDAVPLDFFSWHCYTSDPRELVHLSKAVRQLLDSSGFNSTESHLNEWNFLPRNDWSALSPETSPAVRERFAAEMSSPTAASFVLTALIELQDAPLDVSNFYHGETGLYGLFTEHGVPTHVYHALFGFGQLAGRPRPFVTGGNPGKVVALAALSGRTARILMTNFSPETTKVSLALAPGKGWDGAALKRCNRAGWDKIEPPLISLQTNVLEMTLAAFELLSVELPLY